MSPLGLGAAVRPAWAVVMVTAIVLGSGCRRADEAQPLPRLGRVGQFSLVDQDGTAVTRQAFAGEPWVTAFFFTRCPTVCPLITNRMRKLQQLAARDGGLRLVSVTVDPEHDRAAVLKEFAAARGVDWSLLAGSEEAVKALANSFAVALRIAGGIGDSQGAPGEAGKV
jgi:protein SCO1/2